MKQKTLEIIQTMKTIKLLTVLLLIVGCSHNTEKVIEKDILITDTDFMQIKKSNEDTSNYINESMEKIDTSIIPLYFDYQDVVKRYGKYLEDSVDCQ